MSVEYLIPSVVVRCATAVPIREDHPSETSHSYIRRHGLYVDEDVASGPSPFPSTASAPPTAPNTPGPLERKSYHESPAKSMDVDGEDDDDDDDEANDEAALAESFTEERIRPPPPTAASSVRAATHRLTSVTEDTNAQRPPSTGLRAMQG
jgi:hypothetical protein